MDEQKLNTRARTSTRDPDYSEHFFFQDSLMSFTPHYYIDFSWATLLKQKDFSYLLFYLSLCFYPYLHFPLHILAEKTFIHPFLLLGARGEDKKNALHQHERFFSFWDVGRWSITMMFGEDFTCTNLFLR